MFALAMLRLSGRGGPGDGEEAAKLLASAAKLGSAKAAYNLALLYIDGQTLPQDLKRAAELLRVAADAGNPEAQYALATFYKEGTGVPKDVEKAVRLLQAAALADNVDAEVEYAIALYNGTGTPKNEAAAVALLRKAARQNSPIAQNRLACVLVSGQGAPVDKVEAPQMAYGGENRRQRRSDARRCALPTSARRIAPRPRSRRAQMARREMIRLDASTPAGHPLRGSRKDISIPDSFSPLPCWGRGRALWRPGRETSNLTEA